MGLGEALEELGGAKPRLLPPAQAKLPGDQLDHGGGAAGQGGEAFEVRLDPSGLAARQAALQVGAEEIGQQVEVAAVGGQEFLQAGLLAALPGGHKGLKRPLGGGWRAGAVVRSGVEVIGHERLSPPQKSLVAASLPD